MNANEVQQLPGQLGHYAAAYPSYPYLPPGAVGQVTANSLSLKVPTAYTLALWTLALASVASVAIQLYALGRRGELPWLRK